MTSIDDKPLKAPATYGAQRGAAFSDLPASSNKMWQRCTVTAVHPADKTCSVVTDTGEYHGKLDIPGVNADPLTGAGEFSIPKVGTDYAIHYSLGYPVLTHYPAEVRIREGTDTNARLTAIADVGGEDGIHGGVTSQSHGPTDMAEGDWARVGGEGNLVAVLDNGTTVLKASELAQVICNRGSDLVRLLGRNLQIQTGFGSIDFKSNGNETSMSLRGGANYTDSTSPHLRDGFTIRADAGANGDLVNFRITDPRGKTLAGINYLPDGEVIQTARAVTETVAKDKSTTIDGNYTVAIGGDVLKDVSKTYSLSAGDDVKIESTKNVVSYSGQDSNTSSFRDINMSAGRAMSMSASGDTLALPGDAAMTTDVTNGSWKVSIGDPLSGDLQTALSGMSVDIKGLGDFSVSTTLGKVYLKTAVPDSVQLGGQVALYHAMVYELFEQFIIQLGNMLDTHTHLTGVGPSSPPVVPPFATVSGSVPLIRSNFVTLGG